MNNKFEYVIVGGGVAGLSALERIKQRGEQSVILLERDEECGGLVKSSCEDGFLKEVGPNAFLKNYTHTYQFIEDIGLKDEIIANEPNAHHRFIYRDGAIHPIPEGPIAFFKTPLFSWKTKFRLLLEPFIRSSKLIEESVDDFAQRRFGSEVSSLVMDAMVSGVCAGDYKKLDIHSLFPKISLVEKKFRSFLIFLLLFKFKSREKNKEVNFYSLKNGMGSIAKKVMERHPDNIVINCAVKSITKEGDLYQINCEDKTFFAKNLIMATPANVAAVLLKEVAAKLSLHLDKIPYCSITTALVAYQRDQIKHQLNGFGFLIPRNQGKRILGGLFSSSLFANRAPNNLASIKVYIGGAHDPAINHIPESEIKKIIVEELAEILSIKGEPHFIKIEKINHAIPQYNMGHRLIKEQIRQELELRDDLSLIGNYLEGISVNEAIKSSLD